MLCHKLVTIKFNECQERVNMSSYAKGNITVATSSTVMMNVLTLWELSADWSKWIFFYILNQSESVKEK